MGELTPPHSSSGNTLPESLIECKILHSLQDMIVVSFESQDQRLFQGALLLCNETCKIPFNSEDFNKKLKDNNPKDYKLDSFFTVQNRHTYFKANSNLNFKKNLKKRPTVRLRARQVLCHECKNVCSESGNSVRNGVRNNVRNSSRNVRNSQNDKFNRKRKKSNLRQFHEFCVKTFTLVPRIRRLEDDDIRKFKQNKTKPHSVEKNCDLDKNNERAGEKREMNENHLTNVTVKPEIIKIKKPIVEENNLKKVIKDSKIENDFKIENDSKMEKSYTESLSNEELKNIIKSGK